jgi:hypothetical protein
MDLSPDGAARSTLALTTHTCPYNGFYFRIYIYDEPSSLSLSSAESVRKQLKALTHKKRHPCVAAAAAALLPLMLFFFLSLFFTFRSLADDCFSQARRRREAAGTPQKRHLRAAIFMVLARRGSEVSPPAVMQ